MEDNNPNVEIQPSNNGGSNNKIKYGIIATAGVLILGLGAYYLSSSDLFKGLIFKIGSQEKNDATFETLNKFGITNSSNILVEGGESVKISLPARSAIANFSIWSAVDPATGYPYADLVLNKGAACEVADPDGPTPTEVDEPDINGDGPEATTPDENDSSWVINPIEVPDIDNGTGEVIITQPDGATPVIGEEPTEFFSCDTAFKTCIMRSSQANPGESLENIKAVCERSLAEQCPDLQTESPDTTEQTPEGTDPGNGPIIQIPGPDINGGTGDGSDGSDTTETSTGDNPEAEGETEDPSTPEEPTTCPWTEEQRSECISGYAGQDVQADKLCAQSEREACSEGTELLIQQMPSNELSNAVVSAATVISNPITVERCDEVEIIPLTAGDNAVTITADLISTLNLDILGEREEVDEQPETETPTSTYTEEELACAERNYDTCIDGFERTPSLPEIERCRDRAENACLTPVVIEDEEVNACIQEKNTLCVSRIERVSNFWEVQGCADQATSECIDEGIPDDGGQRVCETATPFYRRCIDGRGDPEACLEQAQRVCELKIPPTVCREGNDNYAEQNRKYQTCVDDIFKDPSLTITTPMDVINEKIQDCYSKNNMNCMDETTTPGGVDICPEAAEGYKTCLARAGNDREATARCEKTATSYCNAEEPRICPDIQDPEVRIKLEGAYKNCVDVALATGGSTRTMEACLTEVNALCPTTGGGTTGGGTTPVPDNENVCEELVVAYEYCVRNGDRSVCEAAAIRACGTVNIVNIITQGGSNTSTTTTNNVTNTTINNNNFYTYNNSVVEVRERIAGPLGDNDRPPELINSERVRLENEISGVFSCLEPVKGVGFNDMRSNYAKEVVQLLADLAYEDLPITIGYPLPEVAATRASDADIRASLEALRNETRLFYPSNNLTRAEALKLVTLATCWFDQRDLNLQTGSGIRDAGFDDVSTGLWFKNIINASEQTGLLEGYSDGTVRPDASITRAEFAVILDRIAGDRLDYCENTSVSANPYSDLRGTEWYDDLARRLFHCEISRGHEYNLNSDTYLIFQGDRNITRHEAAVMLHNFYLAITEDQKRLLER